MSKCSGTGRLLTVDDVCVLSVLAGEAPGRPLRLNARFQDANDDVFLEVVDNEWRARSATTDIVCEAGRICVRHDGRTVLRLAVFPPQQIVVYELHARHKGVEIDVDGNVFCAKNPMGGTLQFGSVHLEASGSEDSILSLWSDRKTIQIAGQPRITAGAGGL